LLGHRNSGLLPSCLQRSFPKINVTMVDKTRERHLVLCQLFAAALLWISMPAASVYAQAAGLTQSAARLEDRAVSVWRSDKGIPQDEIHDIAQTGDGYIWFGTAEGLVRFDGLNFRIYTTRTVPGIPSNNVMSLIVDARGVLWLYANKHVVHYNGDTFVDETSTFTGTSITAIDKDPSGRVVAIGKERAWRYDSEHRQFNVLYEHPLQWHNPSWESYYLDADGSTWLGRSNGDVYHNVNGRLTMVATLRPLDDSPVMAIARDGQHRLWVSAGYGIYQLTGKGLKLRFGAKTWGEGLKLFPERFSMVSDRYGIVWFISGGRLWRILDGRVRPMGLKDGVTQPIWTIRTAWDRTVTFGAGQLLANSFTTYYGQFSDGRFGFLGPANGLSGTFRGIALQDSSGNLWIPTANGLDCFQSTTARTFRIPGLASDRITSLNVDVHGTIWIATTYGMLYTGRGGKLVHYHWAHSLNEIAVSIIRCDNGDLWLTTSTHVYRIRSGVTGAWTSKTVGEGGGITGLTLDRAGGVWICGAGKIAWVAGNRVRIFTATDGLDAWAYVFASYADPDGTMWFGCDSEIFHWDGLRMTKYSATGDFAPLPVIAFHHVTGREVWVALWGGGIVRFLNGKFSAVTARDGLYADGVFQIQSDHIGNLWFSSSRGIFRASRSELNSFADGKKKSVSCFPSDNPGEIARSQGCVDSAGSAVAPDGSLWFAMTRGLVQVQPSHPVTPTLTPLLDRISVNGTTYRPTDAASIAPGVGRVEFDFTAPCFRYPERLRFRYRLIGLEGTWTEASQRSGVYTNLPPGNYRLEVIVADPDGHWSARSAMFAFTLQPHYYQTGWFRAMCVGSLAALALWLFRIRIRQLRLRNELLEIKIAERTYDLTEAKDELAAQNTQLQDMQSELEAQRDELGVQNDTLQSLQAELEAQNDELQQTQLILAERNQQLENLATTDGLTGLKNHRAFQERLEAEWKALARQEDSLSLILLDVDKFKQYNDTFGHPAGDQVLKSVARILTETARETDFVARYGGEEFVIILPRTDSVGALTIAERFRAAIEAHPWPERAVTASFGISTSNTAVHSQAQLVSGADQALYQSKSDGRNRVTHSNELQRAA